MPNRFNDRENGESEYFPRKHPGQRRFESTDQQGQYGPSPRYARKGQDIEQSYGQEYERGVYGHENPEGERLAQRNRFNRGGEFDRDYGHSEYGSGQRHSQYEQGPHFGRGPKGYRRSDERIEEDINERLTQHPFLDATELQVSVQNGDVVLSGIVDDRNAKRIAEDIAESVSGVKDIQNQIRVNKNFYQNK